LPITLVMGCSWFAVSFCYYGFTLGVPSLPVNLYVASLISVCASLPGMSGALVSEHFGSRNALVIAFLGCAFCLSMRFVIEDTTLVLVNFFVGNSFSAVAFAVVYLHTVEVFPTQIRNRALSFLSIAARVGSILAPYVDALPPCTRNLTFVVACLLPALLLLTMPPSECTLSARWRMRLLSP